MISSHGNATLHMYGDSSVNRARNGVGMLVAQRQFPPAHTYPPTGAKGQVERHVYQCKNNRHSYARLSGIASQAVHTL